MTSYLEWFSKGDHSYLVDEYYKLLTLSLLEKDQRAIQQLIAPQAADFNIVVQTNISMDFAHWSRKWEYPWVMYHGDFKPSHLVMDAGGCSSILPYAIVRTCHNVVISDLDETAWSKFSRTPTHRLLGDGLTFSKSDIKNLPYRDGLFNRVVCVSVLEHIDDPFKALSELWRVLAPGGRLILTIDVADSVRHNHTIDHKVASQLGEQLGLKVPLPPEDVQEAFFDEEKPLQPRESPQVKLNILGLFIDKDK